MIGFCPAICPNSATAPSISFAVLGWLRRGPMLIEIFSILGTAMVFL